VIGLPSSPPPGPFRPGFWRSPLRSARLTAILGLVLLIGLPIIVITGLLSNDAYQPGLSGANALGRDVHGPLDVYLFGWPAGPSWLYAVSQGAHVTLGLALFPVVLVKLWSVIPKLFAWPPLSSPAQALERLTVALLVGSVLFEFVTGLMNIQYWYAFGFDFPQAHFYGGWVFIGALIAHITVKLRPMRQALATRDAVLGGHRESTEDALLSPNPAPASMSRRTLLASVAAASGILFLQGIGQSVGGPLRRLTFLLPRGTVGPGPQGFPVNRTFALAGLAADQVGAAWRLELIGRRTLTLTRADLAAMPQHTRALTLGCVEGWSTTQAWTGVPLADLAALVGFDPDRERVSATAQSIEHGTYAQATLGHEQVADRRSLLALSVNGETLSLDHGYPARVIAPGVPGVHNTKWVRQLQFAVQA
jgi:DMSO/TMAO reductase YedYZ molybdopterin-dependent catalytic subunit